MPWKQMEVREQRVEFVMRALGGDPLSPLCREFGVSRPTGYLWIARYREGGVAALFFPISATHALFGHEPLSRRQVPSFTSALIVATSWSLGGSHSTNS